ncbi:hypothetical protein A2630_00755 [Candidatus Woesebacteria bacterium RIFCSPHIGHO2_01_FULL_44_10]|uniref:FAD-binding FR-type domain-containing protein n=1 Tax=Candidatus Woesebacteria bacterium RIFCSPLOWO2_01_FULL_44_14 TaxID=1802525 RepID=A0A1F8C300_9BACT|nr:MAG: hypothetical protein A2630_00755 [Candidatus Woesebacteria bacterium RIFCSPHIGHO2_01_FULL_44_10]OGM70249.1 MAG: hypothetical protein A2975_04220 [Candidatus Woesebacteria bacterium RIFCSPLOWO2_01_FULL_44_14]
MTWLTNLLNRLTMYRLILYVLIGYLTLAVVEGFLGVLPLPPVQIALQAVYLFLVANIANRIFSKIFGAVTNSESATITALILSLIVGPVDFPGQLVFLTLVAIAAMVSKYVLAIRKRHIFNPAALAVTAMAVFGGIGASWWVGSPPLTAFTAIGGFLILTKIKRFTLAAVFLATYLLGSGFLGVSPIIFFVSVMLIEPLTSPVETKKQIIYAGFVAVVLILTQQFVKVGYTLEASLLAGNILFYLLSLPFRTILTLKTKEKLANNTYAFHFAKTASFDYRPGQFLHWTLPHVGPDARGVRRYFTIASSPTQKDIMIAVRVPDEASSFKKTLSNLKGGDQIVAMDAAGEFVLPKDKTIPLAFIAGGIGITPFASMARWLIDKKQERDIVLLYSNSTLQDIAFRKLFDEAQKVGIKTHYVVTEKDGYIDEALIKTKVPDWKKRIYYVSGPQPMVDIFAKMLSKMKVAGIKTDFFPGYTDRHQK